MANNNYPTRVVTGEVRFSYVHLLKPQESNFGGDPKYSAVLLIPKSDTQTKSLLDAAVQAAVQKGKAEKWSNVIPPRLRKPIKDGDGVKESDGMPYGNECKDHWVLSVSTSIDYPPKVVGPDFQPIIDPTEVYSGMFGRIAVNFAPYNSNGNKGVGAYISTNVMKTRDGEPLGASAPDPSADFGAPGAPLDNGASVWNGIPDKGQTQPRINPITGQPM